MTLSIPPWHYKKKAENVIIESVKLSYYLFKSLSGKTI